MTQMPSRRSFRPLRHLADALSAMNALCGVASVVCAARGRPDLSLLLLLVGAVFDGLDGAAARRFGGTRWGVLADDVADGINYALAPGVAIAHAVAGVEGTITGVAFVALTVARLVFFTL
jgi:CDP-diacylglycerol--serine O-phosphatidyltransferase